MSGPDRDPIAWASYGTRPDGSEFIHHLSLEWQKCENAAAIKEHDGPYRTVPLYADEPPRETGGEVERLHDAIRRVAERRRRPDEGHTAWYDRLAEMFYRDTGHMAPGKSAPMEMHRDPEEDRRKWEEWNAEPYEALVAMLPEAEPTP